MSKLCVALGLSGLRLFGVFADPWLSHRDIHRVVGEPARVQRAWDGAAPLKVITWNIERGQAYDAVLRVLRTLDADVLLLQEVDRGCRRTGYRDVARDLSEALGMNWVAAGEFQEFGEGRGGGDALTGQAILSRFPIVDAEVLVFVAQDPWRWRFNPVQPRRGGRIALKARTGGMVVYDAHIESGGNSALKRRQIAEILSHQSRSAGAGAPVVIAGDFNNGPVPHSPIFASFAAAAFADALGDPTHRRATSHGQRHPIDWIFAKNLTPAEGQVVDAPAASDHLPLIAAFNAATVLVGTR